MIVGALLFAPRVVITVTAAVLVVCAWPILWWLDPGRR